MSELIELKAGEYLLPDDMTMERTGKYISIRPKMGILDPNDKRCKDCKYFGHGVATSRGFTTSVCMLQPKGRVSRNGQPLYYHTGTRSLKCAKFEEK